MDSYRRLPSLNSFSPDPSEKTVNKTVLSLKSFLPSVRCFCSVVWCLCCGCGQFSVWSDAVDLFSFEFHGAAGCDWSRASRKNNSEP